MDAPSCKHPFVKVELGVVEKGSWKVVEERNSSKRGRNGGTCQRRAKFPTSKKVNSLIVLKMLKQSKMMILASLSRRGDFLTSRCSDLMES